MSSFLPSRKLRALGTNRLLRLVLEHFESVEHDWSNAALRKRRLHELSALLQELGRIARPELAHVPGLARHLRDDIDLRTLTTWMIPIERAIDRGVRDADILPCTDAPDAEPATMPVSVVADSLRSAFNVGGVFRSAECFGAREVVLTGYSAPPDDARVRKAAMGTTRMLQWRRHRRAPDAVAELEAGGAQTIALEAAADLPTFSDVALRFPCALVIGNERFGLDPSTIERCETAVKIPVFGRKNSLNVVSACSIALHELRHRWENRV